MTRGGECDMVPGAGERCDCVEVAPVQCWCSVSPDQVLGLDDTDFFGFVKTTNGAMAIC